MTKTAIINVRAITTPATLATTTASVISTVIFSCLLVLLSACGNQGAYLLGPKWYNDVEVLVEIRPGKPQVGMNEFIIIATHKNKKPAHEYIISIKRHGSDEWRQSIQDGHSGAYRRALRIVDPVNDVLVVQFQRGDEKGELTFPLKPAP